MKKLINFGLVLLFGLCVFLAGGYVNAVYAAGPYLVCDPDAKATSYLLTFNSGDMIETPAPLYYDLETAERGVNVLSVKAKNRWGVSNAVPFTFTKELPDDPANIGFREEGH